MGKAPEPYASRAQETDSFIEVEQEITLAPINTSLHDLSIHDLAKELGISSTYLHVSIETLALIFQNG
jgi:AraC-like DNA-binding protein